MEKKEWTRPLITEINIAETEAKPPKKAPWTSENGVSGHYKIS